MQSNLEIVSRYGKDDLAILYIGKIDGKIIEFVESIQPPVPREEKWVIIISTLYGCPIQCKMCDAGEYYYGKVSKEGMLGQILHILDQRYPNREIPIPKLKIQFARMGEPSLNLAVLDLLKNLPKVIKAPGLLPCISSVAPNGTHAFFESLTGIKNQYYANGNFQLQFSIHSTDESQRHELISPNIWKLKEISEFGEKWVHKGDRKITLNFIVGEENIIDPSVIQKIFTPDKYLIKLTPINPTFRAEKHQLKSKITKSNYKDLELVRKFEDLGYQTIISIGEWEENQIGSNCGQFATKYHKGEVQLKESYTCHEYQL